MKHNVPIQSLIDHIKTAIDVDPWAKEMVEDLLQEQEHKDRMYHALEDDWKRLKELLKEQGVKHGEWISIWEEDDPDTSTQARCSVCNRVSNRPAGEYCKWCGAKMDLEGR